MRNKILTISFLAFICVFAFGSVIAKDRDFSDMENRNLTKWQPLFTKTGQVNQKFGKNFDSWYNDRFNYRGRLISFNEHLRYKMQNSLKF